MEQRKLNKSLNKTIEEKARQHSETKRILEEANQRITQLEEEATEKKKAMGALEGKNGVRGRFGISVKYETFK